MTTCVNNRPCSLSRSRSVSVGLTCGYFGTISFHLFSDVDFLFIFCKIATFNVDSRTILRFNFLAVKGE